MCGSASLSSSFSPAPVQKWGGSGALENSTLKFACSTFTPSACVNAMMLSVTPYDVAVKWLTVNSGINASQLSSQPFELGNQRWQACAPGSFFSYISLTAHRSLKWRGGLLTLLDYVLIL